MNNNKLFVTTTSGDANAPLTEGVAVSGTSTYYSKKWGGYMADPNGLDATTLHWTGTPTGTLTLWQTDKAEPSETDDTDWVQDTGYSPTNPAGSASKFHTDRTGKPARWKRIKYVNSSGSGVLYGDVSC